jgi:ferritin-like metal-binding protein YciE
MALFWSSSCDSMHRLFICQLRWLYDCELRMIAAMPRFIENAHSERLKRACRRHVGEADGQVKRLERIFDRLMLRPRRETADVLKGLIGDMRDLMRDGGDPSVRDAALIAILQAIEHLEIAGYGTARTWALHLGLKDVADLLDATLAEEHACDRSLTELAESGINAVATYVTEPSEAEA